MHGEEPVLLPRFNYLRAADLGHAVAALAAGGDGAQLLAGGTDLLISMRQGLVAPATLIGIRGLRELDGIDTGTTGDLRIGAGVMLSTLDVEDGFVARLSATTGAAVGLLALAATTGNLSR